MDRLSALGRGTQIMLLGSVLLLIDTFLPWQKFGNEEIREAVEAVGGDLSPSAWRGFLGWVMGLILIVLLAWLAVRIASVNIPLPVSTAMTAGLLGTLILFFALIKNLADDESTIWSYIGVGLAVVIAVGAWQQIQEAGGMETLRSEIPSMPSATAAGSGTAAAMTPPTPPETPTTAPPTTPPTPDSTPAPQPPDQTTPPPSEPPPASTDPTR